jgi:hypothetical protein
MAFSGYLIKVGSTEIPLTYMRAETYSVTPNQRMEWSAERDINGNLHRKTVANMPPKIEFKTPLMTNREIAALNTMFQNAFTVPSERKLQVTYYDAETDSYKVHDCYMPDTQYQIRNVDVAKNIINYEELRFAFIGY